MFPSVPDRRCSVLVADAFSLFLQLCCVNVSTVKFFLSPGRPVGYQLASENSLQIVAIHAMELQ